MLILLAGPHVSSPSRFSEKTPGASSPQSSRVPRPLCPRLVPSSWPTAKVLVVLTPLPPPRGASPLQSDEAAGEKRGETLFFLVAAGKRSLGPFNPSESSSCRKLAFVPVAGSVFALGLSHV